MKKFFGAFLIAGLLLQACPAMAGFGIAPTYIKNHGLFQGDTYEQTVYLLRSKNNEAGKVNITIQAPDVKDWGIDGRTEKIDFPAGSERLPILFKISAPANAKTGKYSGQVEFQLAVESGIAVGAAAELQLNVLSKSLKGRILIQTQENGEAWYINPGDSKRYYLGRPADALAIMSKLSLGVKHSYLAGRGTFPEEQSGRILLDVEDSGKAYYISPEDKKAYYLGRPSDAFAIMKKFGLGITNSDLNNINIGIQ